MPVTLSLSVSFSRRLPSRSNDAGQALEWGRQRTRKRQAHDGLPRGTRVELAVGETGEKDAEDMTQASRARILDAIEKCDDPAALRRFMKNAKQRGGDVVYNAAFQRLITVQPSAQVGTIAHDVWRAVYAFEELRREEGGKTVRLSRTRQKIDRVGEVKTVTDLALQKVPSGGFTMLKDRGRLELSFEALVLARAEHFPSNVVEAARARLEAEGMDIQLAYAYWSKTG